MQKNEPLTVIIDTNLWISFVISNKQKLLDPLLYSAKIRILFSAELIDEIRETIKKPRLKKYFAGNALEKMLSAFDPFIDFITVTSTVSLCRDTKDNFLLALAKDGKADFLITGDKDLLTIETYGDTKITTIAAFLLIEI